MNSTSESVKAVIKIILTVLIASICPTVVMLALVCLLEFSFMYFIYALALLLIPAIIPLIWLKRRKIYALCYSGVFVLCATAIGIQVGMYLYEESITIDVTPNINLEEYLPFKEDSKIVKIDSKTLKLNSDLPVIDGAAALFPVYSAFVNAVYPDSTQLNDGTFVYNNTVLGYELLAEKSTDIFIGAQPSNEQVEYAQTQSTLFEYTQIGSEAFVFFVHKDNPIDSLTTEQIKGIYSGRITNWKEVGGKDEEILPFQRNEGSGSQSMMLRFMGDTPIIEAEKEVIGTMGGIIEEVADYQSRSGSIGFSFRFYVEGIIKNPEIKMIAIDGVAPTVDNIKNDSYPIVAPIYAVTWANNPNENVKKLLDWMLSEEGQYILEETGYVGVKS